MPTDTADDLRMKIANYKRSRANAARSMHRWLDALIADAEDKLRYLGAAVAPAGKADDADADAAASLATTPAVTTGNPFRSTYPFDENAPRQRIL